MKASDTDDDPPFMHQSLHSIQFSVRETEDQFE